MALTWNDLFARGSIVDFNAGQWRARATLKIEDLGIEGTDEVKKAFSMGCHRLAPKGAFKEINRLINAAYDDVQNFSMPFRLIRGARYVPQDRLPELLAKLEAYKLAFATEVAAFIAQYEGMKLEMLPVLRTALQSAAKTPEAAATAIARLAQEYPDPREVAARFRLEWNVYAIQGPQNAVAASALAAEESQVREAVHEMVERLRLDMAEKLETVMAIAARGGTIPDASIKSARELVARLEGMNILGDRTLADGLKKFRAIIDGAATGGTAPTMATDLTALRDEMLNSLAAAKATAEQALVGVGKRRIQTGKAPKASDPRPEPSPGPAAALAAKAAVQAPAEPLPVVAAETIKEIKAGLEQVAAAEVEEKSAHHVGAMAAAIAAVEAKPKAKKAKAAKPVAAS